MFAQDTPHGILARAGRTHAAPHVLDDQKTPAGLQDLLSHAGRRSRTDLLIHERPRPDDRRVAHPPGKLPRQPRRRARHGQSSPLVEPAHADRVVGIGRRRFPLLPRRTGGLRQQVRATKAVGQRELLRAGADQQHVRRFLHDESGHGYRVLDFFQRRHRARPRRRAVHDARVELNHAGGIRITPFAHTAHFGVALRNAHARLDRIEHRAAPFQRRCRSLVCGYAVRPRRNHDTPCRITLRGATHLYLSARPTSRDHGRRRQPRSDKSSPRRSHGISSSAVPRWVAWANLFARVSPSRNTGQERAPLRVAAKRVTLHGTRDQLGGRTGSGSVWIPFAERGRVALTDARRVAGAPLCWARGMAITPVRDIC